jgi:hypothetical protein
MEKGTPGGPSANHTSRGTDREACVVEASMPASRSWWTPDVGTAPGRLWNSGPTSLGGPPGAPTPPDLRVTPIGAQSPSGEAAEGQTYTGDS